jgi:hypothetical protein
MHFKHLRGQHDQRTHGKPGTGIGAGGYASQLGQYSSSSSPQPRTNFLTDGKIPTELAQVGVDGLPSMKRVERGSNDIRNLDNAIDFVENGGSLRDVPDDFLLEAIQSTSRDITASWPPAGSTRFEHKRLGSGGINGRPTLYTDTTNGQRYFSKYVAKSYRPNEDVAEILGNNLAGRLGFPIGAVRVAEGQGKSPFRKPIILEHVSNAVSGAISEPGVNFFPWQLPYDDMVSAAILDYILLNPDRHGGNYFFADQSGAGDPRFVPIDPSLGFNVLGANRWSRPVRVPVRGPIEMEAETTPDAIQYYYDTERGFARVLRQTLMGRATFSTSKPDMKIYNQERKKVVEAVEKAKIRLLESEKQLPFSVAAIDALRATGSPMRNRRTNEGVDQPLPGLENFGSPRNMRKSFWGDGIESFTTWPSKRIETVIGTDSDRFARYLLAES